MDKKLFVRRSIIKLTKCEKYHPHGATWGIIKIFSQQSDSGHAIILFLIDIRRDFPHIFTLILDFLTKITVFRGIDQKSTPLLYYLFQGLVDLKRHFINLRWGFSCPHNFVNKFFYIPSGISERIVSLEKVVRTIRSTQNSTQFLALIQSWLLFKVKRALSSILLWKNFTYWLSRVMLENKRFWR